MKGIQSRVVRLVALLSVAGVVMLGSSSAFAADPISKFGGSSNATALAVTASPNAILNADLSRLNTILAQLPLVGATVNGLANGTLANVTEPVTVIVDQAHSQGLSTLGHDLVAGNGKSTQSTTTPVAINAKSLDTELSLLKSALKNIPASAIVEVNTLLSTLPGVAANNATLLAVEKTLTDLSVHLSDDLGHPAVNVFDTATAVLGGTGDNPANNANVSTRPGFLTSGPFVLGPFLAEALKSDSTATNTLTSLSLAPTGRLGLPSITDLLTTLLANLQALESDLKGVVTSTTKTIPGVGGLLGSTVVKVVDKVTGITDPALLKAVNALNGAYNKLVSALAPVFDALHLIDNLKLNDLLGTGPSTAFTSLARDTATGIVTSAALSNLAHVDALKITNPLLMGLLQKVNIASGAHFDLTKSLVGLDGVKGTASVTADGVQKTVQNANGQLIDISVLGRSLKELTGSLDTILPQGSVCIIQVPGTINCPGLAGGAAVAALNAINAVLGNIPAINGLITITLTRGANIVNVPGPDVHGGSAGIVTLEVNVAIDCSKVPLLGTVNGALANLQPVATLSLCPAPAPKGRSTLLDVQVGVANAMLGSGAELCASTDPICGGGPPPPNTGSNDWILAAFAAMLLAAGVGIRRWRATVRG